MPEKEKTTIEKTAFKPVNKTAALVVSNGVHYQPDKKVLAIESETPMPTKRLLGDIKLEGVRFGGFRVVGRSRDHSGMWVVRCDCGKYGLRKTKAIRNPNNNKDCCEHCRHVQYLVRHNREKALGLVEQSRASKKL